MCLFTSSVDLKQLTCEQNCRHLFCCVSSSLMLLEGSGGTEFLSKTIKLRCVCGWAFQCIGMCSLLYPVQAPAEGQNPAISKVSEIPLLLLYKSVFHLNFLAILFTKSMRGEENAVWFCFQEMHLEEKYVKV